MNKALRLLSAAALMLFAIFNLHSQTCTNNLLANPGFESGLTGWTITGDVTITTTVHSGTKAAHLGGNGYASVGQAFAATPGTDYTLKAWSKYAGSLGYRAVELRFLNAAWANISTNSIYAVSTSTYAECVLTGTAPAGTAYVYLLASKDGAGSIDVDDLCLTVGGTGGPVCTITPSVTNVVCNDNGTPNNPADDRFSFTVNVTNPVAGTGYQMVSPQLSQTYHGTYGSPLNIQNVPISTGSVYMNFTDNITANCTAATYVTPPAPCSSASQLPDLNGIVQEIIPAVNNCFTPPGQSFTYLSMQIMNSGDVAAGAFKVKFYFSMDNVLSANDVLWSTVNLPSLNIMSNGGPAFVSPNQPVPTSLAPNRYYVIVTIDGENQVAESNEANNTVTPFQVEIGAPDIRMLDHAGLAANVVAGSSFPMQVTLSYLSNGYPMPTNTSMTISVSLVDVSPAIVVGTANYLLSEFNQSNTLIKTVQVNLPANLTLGSRYFNISAGYSFCEDPTNNSQFQYANVTAATGSGIDLELSMQQNTANPVIYSNYTTTLTIVNKGPQAATGVKVKWLKPAGVVYTGGNEFVASQGSFNPNGDQIWTVGSLPANGTATLRVSYFLLQNGAPITYAQVSAANETDVDSQPNNGTSPTPVQDDEANSGGSAPPVLTPDLTISNLVITNSPVQPGQVLTYNFDLANIGNGNAPQDFIVRAWISTSPNSSSGIQDGVVPTGNFNAGFSVSGVPGASTIPSNLADGQYYLYLWLDADLAVSETNESNNTIYGSFIVHGETQPGTCDELLGPGSIHCLSQNASGQLEVIYKPTTELRKAVLDGTGQVISDAAFGPEPLVTSYQVNLGKLEKTVGQTLVYSKTVPAAILSQYNQIVGFTEFNNGYVLFGYKTSNASTYALRTNANLEVLQTALLTTSYNGIAPYVNNTGQLSPNEIRFVLKSQPGQQIAEANTLYVMNGDLTIASTEVLTSGIFYGTVSIVPNGCGNYNINIFRQINFCTHGACFGQEFRQGRFENGHFVTDASAVFSTNTSLGSGTIARTWYLRTNDGGQIVGTATQQVYLSQPSNNPPIHLKKTLGTTTVWERDVPTANVSAVRWLALSGSELVFLSEKNNAVFVEALTCLEGTTPPPPVGCDAIAITPGPGQVTIAGATAPHVLIKVFRPNWTVAFECLDNCANPLTITGLTNGTYHVQVKLIDNSWGTICYLERDLAVSSIMAADDNRQRLSFERIYPNPSKYEVFVDVFSPVAQAATLDFYDMQGRIVHTMTAELDEGMNTVNVMVYDWKSGTYNVIARGDETALPAYGRLMKVWEE